MAIKPSHSRGDNNNNSNDNDVRGMPPPPWKPTAAASQKSKIVCAVMCAVVVLKLLGETMLVNQTLLRGGGGGDDLDRKERDADASLLESVRDLLTQTRIDAEASSNASLAELRKADRTIAELREQIEDLRRSSEAAAAAAAASSNATVAAVAPWNSKNFDPTDVCSIFPSGGGVSTSSATVLWKHHARDILEASQNPSMENHPGVPSETEGFRILLETVLNPARLRRSVRHLPTYRTDILDRVMGIVQNRLKDPANNPPLRIAVFGGSVTIGRECIKGRMQYLDCAWPKRFELLLNRLIGSDVVEIHNLGIGGTGSKTGVNRIKYWMYGRNKILKRKGPDVIINSYSTNDSLPPWDKKWPVDDLPTIVRRNVHDVLESFVRAALESKAPCDVPPLVVHVDDYLGPQEPDLLGHLAYVQEMTQIAKHYDTMAVSYGEVVRDLVYQNQTDTTFAGIGDVHFGAKAHQTVAWSVGFATLQLLINYCDDRHTPTDNTDGAPPSPPIEDAHPLTRDEMREKKLYLPPALRSDLLLDDAAKEFQTALEKSYQKHVANDCANHDAGIEDDESADRNPCVESWISTPGNFASGDIQNFMNRNRHGGVNDGWEAERQSAEGWSNKDGWIATKENAVFEISFPKVAKQVRTVSIYFLRSYGYKWKDSSARFAVSGSGAEATAATTEVVAEHVIAGVHAEEDFRYSLTLSETIELSKPVPIGGTVSLRVDLVGGSHFKIMGMMLCNK